MNDKSYIVYPIKRIAASVYDLFLLLGVWFAVGSFAVWSMEALFRQNGLDHYLLF